MNSTQAKQLAHELTMEYIKINTYYLEDVKDNIPEMVDMIADINKRFYDSIVNHMILADLY